MPVIRWEVGLAALFLSQSAYAHGIAGNRYFPGTLTFDDPAVEIGVISTLRPPGLSLTRYDASLQRIVHTLSSGTEAACRTGLRGAVHATPRK